MCVALGVMAGPQSSYAGFPAELSYGGGIFVGYRFGAAATESQQPIEVGALVYGAELYAMHRFESSTQNPRWCGEMLADGGVGPMLRITRVHRQSTELAATALVGGTLSEWSALAAELGGIYTWGRPASFGFVAGMRAEYGLASGYLRSQWKARSVRPELGLGVISGITLFQRPFALIHPCPSQFGGRRWRDSSSLERSATCGAFPINESAEGHGLASHWAAQAQAELESVPAFLQLALELLEAGAPRWLVEEAIRAAQDEVVHAELCHRVAKKLGFHGTQPALGTQTIRPALVGHAALERLFRESWQDGCLGEGQAAAAAAWSARHSREVEVATVQGQIARDEARHAELAWRVLAWSGSRLRSQDAFRSRQLLELNDVESNELVAQTRATRHSREVELGWVPPAVQRRLRANVRAEAEQRVAQLLR